MASAIHEPPRRPGHLTSASPQDSIGRWRRDLASSQQEHLEQLPGSCARALGYE